MFFVGRQYKEDFQYNASFIFFFLFQYIPSSLVGTIFSKRLLFCKTMSSSSPHFFFCQRHNKSNKSKTFLCLRTPLHISCIFPANSSYLVLQVAFKKAEKMTTSHLFCFNSTRLSFFKFILFDHFSCIVFSMSL